MKSERLKKLETELQDLEQWLKLGLVPKKEIDRHKGEIAALKSRIGEEKERLQFLKESGGVGEEYTAPRRSPAKTVYPETPTFTEFDIEESESVEFETEALEYETQAEEETLAGEEEEEGAALTREEEIEEEDEEDEDPFSDRNRWRRGGIVDPDATEW